MDQNYPGKYLLNIKPYNKQSFFDWTAFYKPKSLPSSTVGSSSASNLIRVRRRRT